MNSGNVQKSENNLPSWVWVLLIIPVFLYPFLNKPKERNSALNGKPAPALSFQDLQGHSDRLENYRGRLVLLNFWASWCGPCMSEMESLKKLHEELAPRGFAVLAVNVEEKAEIITGLPADIQSTLPPLVFHSPGEEIWSYNVSSLPLSLLVSKEGTIVKIYYGSYRWSAKSLEKEFGHFLN